MSFDFADFVLFFGHFVLFISLIFFLVLPFDMRLNRLRREKREAFCSKLSDVRSDLRRFL